MYNQFPRSGQTKYQAEDVDTLIRIRKIISCLLCALGDFIGFKLVQRNLPNTIRDPIITGLNSLEGTPLKRGLHPILTYDLQTE